MAEEDNPKLRATYRQRVKQYGHMRRLEVDRAEAIRKQSEYEHAATSLMTISDWIEYHRQFMDGWPYQLKREVLERLQVTVSVFREDDEEAMTYLGRWAVSAGIPLDDNTDDQGASPKSDPLGGNDHQNRGCGSDQYSTAFCTLRAVSGPHSRPTR
jgi:hypothetical protein